MKWFYNIKTFVLQIVNMSHKMTVKLGTDLKVGSRLRFMSIFSLLFHCQAGFQFHHNLLIENDNSIDQPSDECFTVLRNGCGHFFQKSNHVIYSCLQIIKDRFLDVHFQ